MNKFIDVINNFRKSRNLIGKLFLYSVILITIIISLGGFSEGALTDGLMHYYGLDNNLNDTFYTSNVSGQGGWGYNTTGCKLGSGCVSFPAGNDYLNVSSWGMPSFNNTGYTLNYWVKPQGTFTGMNIFMVMDYTTCRWLDTYTMKCEDYDGVNNPMITPPNNVVNLSNWFMITQTYNLTNITLYVNNVKYPGGKLLGSKTNPNYHAIGGSPFNTVYPNQTMDDIGFWNRTLTDAEITSLYNNYNGLAYPFSGTSPDYSPVLISRSISDITTFNVISNPLILVYNFSQQGLNVSSPYINYSLTQPIIINGSNVASPYTSYYINNTGINYTFRLTDNSVYPGVYNVLESTIENTPHNNYTIINSNEFYKVNLYGVNSSQTNSILEMDVSVVGSGIIYYCNSTYVSGAMNSNNNCVLFASLNTSTYNHTHNNSRHNVFNMPIINGSIGLVRVTSNSSFAIGKNSGTAYLSYVNISVRNDTVMKSINLGQVWNLITPAVLVDLHVHQYNNNDSITWNACASNTTTTLCSTSVTDNFDLTNLPPTSFLTYTNQSITYYGDNLSINYTNATSTPNVSVISNYTSYIVNTNLEIERLIGTVTTLNQSTMINNLKPGTYFILVVAKDNFSQTSNSLSDSFTVNSKLLSPCNQTFTENSSGISVLFNFSVDSSITSRNVLGLNTPYFNYTLATTLGYNNIIGVPNGSYELWFNMLLNDSTVYNQDTSCTIGVCVSSWQQVLEPCTTDLKLIHYSDLRGCSIAYNVPSDNGTYLACVTPANTDKDLWLIMLLIIFWIISIILTIFVSPWFMLSDFILSVLLLLSGNTYFGNNTALTLGITLIFISAMTSVISIFSRKGD